MTFDSEDIPPLASDEDITAMVERERDGKKVRAAFVTLPFDQQQVVILAYFGGLTHRGISERAVIPLGRVMGWMRLALEILRIALPQGEAVTDSSNRIDRENCRVRAYGYESNRFRPYAVETIFLVVTGLRLP
jgi:hypothetical protein